MWESRRFCEISKEVVGRGEILLLDFHAFLHSAISTALFFISPSPFVPAFVDSVSAMDGCLGGAGSRRGGRGLAGGGWMAGGTAISS